MRYLAMTGSQFGRDADAGIGLLPGAPQNSTVEYSLDPLQNPGCGLGFAEPERLQDVQHLRSPDVGHRTLADLWKGVGRHRAVPLRDVLAVRQFLAADGKEGFKRFFERHAMPDYLCLSDGPQVFAVLAGRPQLGGLATGFLQADIGPDSEPALHPATIDGQPQGPAFDPPVRYDKPKSGAILVKAGILQFGNLECTQPAGSSSSRGSWEFEGQLQLRHPPCQPPYDTVI